MNRKKRFTAEERKKKLTGRRRSLSRRKKEIPEELKRAPRPKKSRTIARRRKSSKPRTTIYQKLGDLIKSKRGQETISLTFVEIEKILDRPLPASARKYKAWWANNRSSKATSRHSKAWMNYGYLVADVNFKKGVVTFDKARGRRQAIPYAAMLLQAARSLQENNRIPFSRRALFAEVARFYPRILIHDQALNPVIQAMTEKSNSARMVAERWRGTFKRVSRGQYNLNKKGVSVDLLRPRTVKIKGKTIKTRLKYYLMANKNWNLAKGSLKAGRGLPEIPFDLVSDDGSIAVRILRARSLKGKDRGRVNLFDALYSLEKVPAKKKLLVIEEKSARKRGVPSDYLVKTFGKFFKNIEVCKYVLGAKPEKDSLTTLT